MTITPPTAQASLDDWLQYLESLHPNAIDLGLERISQVAARLPQLDCVRIVVGGTNGKGSTCAMLESILLSSGYKVGKYTSPHLLCFNERICINGAQASDAAIVAALQEVERVRGAVSLTYFEMTTLAAIVLFAQARLDVAIMEVGLGGRLDAVNILDADCAILSSIDIDHTEWLGTDREAIGLEKAHIFRSGKPAICADPMPPDSVLEYATKIGADLWRVGVDFNYSGDRQQWAYGGREQRRAALGYPALRGANQLLNASAALAALEALSDKIVVTQQDVRMGLLHVSLPARMQILPGLPATILDVAHNPHAASALGQNLDSMGHFPHTYAVVGMLHDKNIFETLSRLAPRVDRWMCASTSGPRGTSAAQLAEIIASISGTAQPLDPFIAQTSELSRSAPKKPGVRAAPRPAVAQHAVEINTYPDPVAAFDAARSLATDNDRILVFGSFATVGPVMQTLRAEGRDIQP